MLWLLHGNKITGWMNYFFLEALALPASGLIKNLIKVAHRYVVQVSDTTMLTIAASLPGHKFFYTSKWYKNIMAL